MKFNEKVATQKVRDAMKSAGWLAISTLIFGGCMLVPRDCRAEAKCPWLNAATAAGLLGGDVEMAVTVPNDPGPGKGVGQATYPDQVRLDRFDVSCEFSRRVDSTMFMLRIEVKTMANPGKEFLDLQAHCDGSTVTLRAIGNEAVQCLATSFARSSSNRREQVIARVRDRSFVLTVARTLITPGDTTALRDDTRNIAEQIAGSLF